MNQFILPSLSLIGAVIAWFWNERRKRVAKEYIRKEKKYEALIEALRGFQTDAIGSPEGRESRNRFLLELNKSWLYCPDGVIEKIYAFIVTVHTDRKHTDEEREHALGELMITIRKDILSRRPVRKTCLKANDFKLLKSN